LGPKSVWQAKPVCFKKTERVTVLATKHSTEGMMNAKEGMTDESVPKICKREF